MRTASEMVTSMNANHAQDSCHRASDRRGRRDSWMFGLMVKHRPWLIGLVCLLSLLLPGQSAQAAIGTPTSIGSYDLGVPGQLRLTTITVTQAVAVGNMVIVTCRVNRNPGDGVVLGLEGEHLHGRCQPFQLRANRLTTSFARRPSRQP